MASSRAAEAYDLLILVDATSSMSNYLAALRQSLPQVISISALTNCFERIGLLAYRDYCDHNIVEWSGWMEPAVPKDERQPDVVAFAKELIAIGGGDYPEATKTGLSESYRHMRADATTLILLYTDAPPHVDGEDTGYSNAAKEMEALSIPKESGQHGKLFLDWVSAAQTLRAGEKKAHVISILDESLSYRTTGYYEFLSAVTNGASVFIEGHKPADISQVTVEILLAWMGVRKDGSESAKLPANLRHCTNSEDIMSVLSERDALAKRYLDPKQKGSLRSSFNSLKLSTEVLDTYLPKKETPLYDFAKTYHHNAAYRQLVLRQLRDIIERDVCAISLNPVFGSLWRTFANDRGNEQRQEVLDLLVAVLRAFKMVTKR